MIKTFQLYGTDTCTPVLTNTYKVIAIYTTAIAYYTCFVLTDSTGGPAQCVPNNDSVPYHGCRRFNVQETKK